MKTIVKFFVASLVIFFALDTFSYAGVLDGSKVTSKVIGTTVNLIEQNIVWHEGKNYVVEIDKKNYLAKADDDGRAIIVERIHNLASFVANPAPVIAAAPVPAYWYHPWYNSFQAPVIGFGLNFYHPIRVYHPIRHHWVHR